MSDSSGNIIKIGPVGSKNGNTWDEKGKNKIFQIFISHDDEINGVQFEYVENGSMLLSETYGANDGYKFDVVKIKHPAEYITSISGHKSSNNSHLCSITFGTNHGDYGPFGKFNTHDKEFIFRLGEDRQFSGFHGTADNGGVKSIGVYLQPITSLDRVIDKINGGKIADKMGENWEMLNGDHE